MRWFKLTLSSLTLALVFCAPALAQSSPAAYQYDAGDCNSEVAGVSCAQSVAGGIEDFANNAEKGTDAVNDAVEGPIAGTSTPEASASSEAVLPTGTGAPPESASSPGPDTARGGATTVDGEEPVSITVLPETGGASLVTLTAGSLLVVFGLAVRRVAGR